MSFAKTLDALTFFNTDVGGTIRRQDLDARTSDTVGNDLVADFGSLSDRGTHIGKPLNAIEKVSIGEKAKNLHGRLTCDTGIDIIRSEFRVELVAC